MDMVVCVLIVCSVFDNGPIPYPKREFLADDENEEKAETTTSKVRLFSRFIEMRWPFSN